MKKILIIGGQGYIGSSISNKLLPDYDVKTVDLNWHGNIIKTINTSLDFDLLEKAFLETFDIIVFLAGHSSVQMCNNDPCGAIQNNLTKFINFLYKINGKKLIYASSSCVYNHIKNANENKDINCNDVYSFTKFSVDKFILMNKLDIEYYGLRLGTVNGFSLNFRNDLMINKMIHDSLATKKITVSNSQFFRPILSIEDLSEAIKKIIDTTEKNPGIYNLCSYNESIGQIAKTVASICGSEIIHEKNATTTFDFTMNCSKFNKKFNFKPSNNSTNIIVESILSNYNKIMYNSKRELPGNYK